MAESTANEHIGVASSHSDIPVIPRACAHLLCRNRTCTVHAAISGAAHHESLSQQHVSILWLSLIAHALCSTTYCVLSPASLDRERACQTIRHRTCPYLSYQHHDDNPRARGLCASYIARTGLGLLPVVVSTTDLPPPPTYAVNPMLTPHPGPYLFTLNPYQTTFANPHSASP
jgi:hypothetical protein